MQLKPDLANTKEFKLTGEEDFWEDDELLQPVMEDDALLFGNAKMIGLLLCLLFMHASFVAFEELEIADDIPEDMTEKEAQGEPT